MSVISSAVRFSTPLLVAAAIAACGGGADGDDPGGGGGQGASGGAGAGGSTTGGGAGGEAPSTPRSLTVHLTPRAGVSGAQRVSFAVPVSPGVLDDPSAARVLLAGDELPSARRGIAWHPDGSVRSVQIQVDLDIAGEVDLDVHLGEPPQAGDLDLVEVAETLDPPDGTSGPRVWAQLSAAYLSASGVAGPQIPEADVEGTELAAWSALCDYDAYNVDAFLSMSDDASVWLFDRGTALYRGHARRGDLGTLESAYREAAIYRAGITGTGSSTAIGVPGKADDMKYYYSQNMAIHYLLTGDDRFRESAEQIAFKMGEMWNPHYGGGDAFWTERHAGFLLLAYVWAATVSDDRAEELAALADDVVDALVDVQETYPVGYSDPDARCYAHSSDAHGEGYGFFGCSPWMSAIVADGLDAYATLRGGERADKARGSVQKLARIIAEQGRDADGRPYYFMGVGDGNGEPDYFEEHWGESAYILAMAWAQGGKSDAALEQAAGELTHGFATLGEAPHMRSFNWQCRSAVATPYYLK